MISSTGALGNDHPRDPLQRPGRVTSGLARGGEERGSRARERVYIRARACWKVLVAHIQETVVAPVSLFCAAANEDRAAAR